jgi:hypothetical protein
LIVVLLAIGGFVLWALDVPAPMPEAIAALQSDQSVEVSTGQWLAFRPRSAEPTVGFIFYPGGKVDARSYAPAVRAIAAQGFLAVIVPMPLNLAFFGAGRAGDVIAAYPTVKRWAIGGHSLGGVVAASFSRSHLETIKGLVLWASYPAETDNLASSGLVVASIYGTEDGLTARGQIDASRALLPPATRWVAIEGGNHGQFGWYGEQAGDRPAAISRQDQQRQIVSATLDLLQSL